MGYKPTGNAVLDKSFAFACRIALFAEELKKERKFEIASQILRAGTSIGANVREAQRAVSTKDFKNRLSIALKEADETSFWLDVLTETKLHHVPEQIEDECQVLIKLLVSIIKNS